MKKLLGISLVAALAVSPMMAMAEAGDVVSAADPAHANSPTVTETAPGYALATEVAGDEESLATAKYVKGAYNASIKAINKVNADAQNKIGDTTALTTTAKNLVGAIEEVKTAATNAASSANSSYDHTESGLSANNVQAAIDELADEKIDKTSIETTLSNSSTDEQVASAKAVYDGLALKQDASDSTVANGTYNYIQQGTGVGTNLVYLDTAVGNLDTAVDGLDTAVTANTNAITVLNGDASTTGSVAKAVADAMTTVQGDFATKAGVLATINASTVDVMAAWGDTTPTQVYITAPGTYQTGAVNNNNNEEPEEEPEEP